MENHKFKMILAFCGAFILAMLLVTVLLGTIIYQKSDTIINSNLHDPNVSREINKLNNDIQRSRVIEHQPASEPHPEHVTQEEKVINKPESEWTPGRLKLDGSPFNVLNNEHGERLIWTCKNPNTGIYVSWESKENKGMKSTMAVVSGTNVALVTGIRIGTDVKVIPDPNKHEEQLNTMIEEINVWLDQHKDQDLEALTENKTIYKFFVPTKPIPCR